MRANTTATRAFVRSTSKSATTPRTLRVVERMTRTIIIRRSPRNARRASTSGIEATTSAHPHFHHSRRFGAFQMSHAALRKKRLHTSRSAITASASNSGSRSKPRRRPNKMTEPSASRAYSISRMIWAAEVGRDPTCAPAGAGTACASVACWGSACASLIGGGSSGGSPQPTRSACRIPARPSLCWMRWRRPPPPGCRSRCW